MCLRTWSKKMIFDFLKRQTWAASFPVQGDNPRHAKSST
jgi:hypothetical protein